jgi:hypothetical protein
MKKMQQTIGIKNVVLTSHWAMEQDISKFSFVMDGATEKVYKYVTLVL